MKKYGILILIIILSFFVTKIPVSARKMKLEELYEEIESFDTEDEISGSAYIIGKYVFTSLYDGFSTKDMMYAATSIAPNEKATDKNNQLYNKIAIAQINRVGAVWEVAKKAYIGNVSLNNNSVLDIEYINYIPVKDLKHVTFKYNDGVTEDKVKAVVDGEKVEDEKPEREDYEFVGWKIKDNEDTELYKFDTPVTEDITLEAVWKHITCHATDENSLKEAFKDGETCTNVFVENNITVNKSIDIMREVNVEGTTENGTYTITMNGNNAWVENGDNYIFKVFAEVTMKNLKLTKALTGIYVGENGNLTATSLDLSDNKFGGVDVKKGSKFTGTNITNTTEKYSEATVRVDYKKDEDVSTDNNTSISLNGKTKYDVNYKDEQDHNQRHYYLGTYTNSNDTIKKAVEGLNNKNNTYYTAKYNENNTIDVIIDQNKVSKAENVTNTGLVAAISDLIKKGLYETVAIKHDEKTEKYESTEYADITEKFNAMIDSWLVKDDETDIHNIKGKTFTVVLTPKNTTIDSGILEYIVNFDIKSEVESDVPDTVEVGKTFTFNISTEGNGDAGKMVVGIGSITDSEGHDAMDSLEKVEVNLKNVCEDLEKAGKDLDAEGPKYGINKTVCEEQDGWATLEGAFGMAGEGYPLEKEKVTREFRVSFKEAGTYNISFKVVLKDAQDTVISQVKKTITVTNKKYTVNFKGVDTPIDSVTVESGKTVSKPTDEQVGTKDEHKFLGWKIEGKEDNELYDFEKPVTSDLNLVAVWVRTIYHLTENNTETFQKLLDNAYCEKIIIETDLDTNGESIKITATNDIKIEGKEKHTIKMIDGIQEWVPAGENYVFKVNGGLEKTLKITFKNLKITGAIRGIHVGKNTEVTLDNVDLSGNTQAGADIEIGSKLIGTNVTNDTEDYYAPTVMYEVDDDTKTADVVINNKDYKNLSAVSGFMSHNHETDNHVNNLYITENHNRLFSTVFNYKSIRGEYVEQKYNENVTFPEKTKTVYKDSLYDYTFLYWKDTEDANFTVYYPDDEKKPEDANTTDNLKVTKDRTFVAIYEQKAKTGTVTVSSEEELKEKVKDNTTTGIILKKGVVYDVGKLEITNNNLSIGSEDRFNLSTIKGSLVISGDNVNIEDVKIFGDGSGTQVNENAQAKGKHYVIDVTNEAQGFSLLFSTVKNDTSDKAYSLIHLPDNGSKIYLQSNMFYTDNVYNTLEFGQTGTGIGDGSYIGFNSFNDGKDSVNNHINIYSVANNATITIRNNDFDISKNAIRLSNIGNHTATFNLLSNKYYATDEIEDKQYAGFVLFQEYGNDKDFSKYTLNVDNLIFYEKDENNHSVKNPIGANYSDKKYRFGYYYVDEQVQDSINEKSAKITFNKNH